jgi:hypothetical protein
MRAIAFRRKELHEERDTLNAYAVYKTRDDAIDAGKRVSGVVFEEKHLRADLADGSVRVREAKKLTIIRNHQRKRSLLEIYRLILQRKPFTSHFKLAERLNMSELLEISLRILEKDSDTFASATRAVLG